MGTTRICAAAVAALAVAAGALAQDAAAPRETVTASVGGKKVAIEYGRASLKGRTLDQLMTQLPPDRIWRTGVDQVTTLKTDTALFLGGKKVPAGKYTVYMHIPVEGNASLVLNSDKGIPLIKLWDKAPASMANEPWPHLEGYSNIAATEVSRAEMRPGTAAPPTDLFTIAMAPNQVGATATLSWGDRSWSLDLVPAK
ncbi:MAG TPA: DUF2911 domain-containing protein [Vicinamibacteria bacterium]|nr:DUF2911 domain-containing protein [Vicinamibacteria bacterium]